MVHDGGCSVVHHRLLIPARKSHSTRGEISGGGGGVHPHAPADKRPIVVELLDVAIEFDGAVVAAQCISVVPLQEVHAAEGEVRERLLAVAAYGRSEELRGFDEVAAGGGKRSHGKHVAEALRGGLAQVESCSKVFEGS